MLAANSRYRALFIQEFQLRAYSLQFRFKKKITRSLPQVVQQLLPHHAVNDLCNFLTVRCDRELAQTNL